MTSSKTSAMCQFGHLNLLDVPRSTVVGRVDVIFCRNVLIYFDDESRRRVIDMFYDRLLPGGYLLLGHSESLLNISHRVRARAPAGGSRLSQAAGSGARFFATGDPFRRDSSSSLATQPSPPRAGSTGRPVPIPAPSDRACAARLTSPRAASAASPPEIAALIAESNATENAAAPHPARTRRHRPPRTPPIRRASRRGTRADRTSMLVERAQANASNCGISR